MFVTTRKHKDSVPPHLFIHSITPSSTTAATATVSMKLHWGMYLLRITYHCILTTTTSPLIITERRRLLSLILYS